MFETRTKSRKELVSKVLRVTLLGYEVMVKISNDPIWAALTFLVFIFEKKLLYTDSKAEAISA